MTIAGAEGRKKGRGERADVAVRERLLACATALFARKGYAATTVREIVAAAGVTKPVLYYHFASKEGIFVELLRAPSEKFMALVDGLAKEEGSARERIRRLAVETHALVGENLDLVRIMYAIYYGPRQGAPAVDFDAYHDRFRSAVREMIEDGIRRAEFRDADGPDMTWAVIGAVNIAMEIDLCHPELSIGTEGLSRVLDLIFKGIAEKSGSEKGAGR